MATVFVSYSRDYLDRVTSLARDLGALGHEAWIDRDLTGGRSWWDHILERIRECDAFVFALAPAALESQACKLELAYATRLGKPVLPVLVDGIDDAALPPGLARIQHVDYRGEDKQAVFGLLRAFAALPPAPPLPVPLPEPPAPPLSYLSSFVEQIDAPTLSFQEQTALALKLKQGLQDPKSADKARALLRRLRAREDLFARVSDEIDAMLVRPVPSAPFPGWSGPDLLRGWALPAPLGYLVAMLRRLGVALLGAATSPSSPAATRDPARAPAEPATQSSLSAGAVKLLVLSGVAGFLLAAMISASVWLNPEEFVAIWFGGATITLIAALAWRGVRLLTRRRA